MGEFDIWHWLVVLVVVLLLFGSGKVSTLMGDVASGIKAFKKNLADTDKGPATQGKKAPEPLQVAKAEELAVPAESKETVAAEHK